MKYSKYKEKKEQIVLRNKSLKQICEDENIPWIEGGDNERR